MRAFTMGVVVAAVLIALPLALRADYLATKKVANELAMTAEYARQADALERIAAALERRR